jgi:hypothetical protein
MDKTQIIFLFRGKTPENTRVMTAITRVIAAITRVTSSITRVMRSVYI